MLHSAQRKVACLVLAALTVLSAAPPGEEPRPNTDLIEIEIVGRGADAKYIKKGDSAQKEVEVIVGEKVRWVNRPMNRTHTATSELKGPDGKPLFTTGDLRGGQASPDIAFDERMYKMAGGEPGGAVTLSYFCEYHSGMRSSIKLRGRVAAPVAVSVRRILARQNVAQLSGEELANLRSAFEKVRASGEYDRQVRLHRSSAEHQNSLFLPWHRAYLYYFEKKLQDALPNADPPVTLPYWNYDRTEDSFRELPEPFRPRTVDDKPNPLYRGRYQGWNAGSRRLPYESVRSDRIINSFPDYFDFRRALELGPHNYVHNNLSPTMANVRISPEDPIFWLHHANVDRIWDRWSNTGGHQNPTDPAWRAQRLRGFAEQPKNTAGDFLDIQALEYTYVQQLIPLRFAFSSQKKGYSSTSFRLTGLTNKPGSRVQIRIPAVRIPEKQNVAARVYISPSNGEDSAAEATRLFVGDFTVLAMGDDKRHDVEDEVVLDATEAARKALALRAGAAISVTIIPETPEGVEPTAATLSFEAPKIVISD